MANRVAACFFPKAPNAQNTWNQPQNKKKPSARVRTYNRALHNRMALLSGTPGLRAGVQCALNPLPGEGADRESPVKLVLGNHGDEYGEERRGYGPVTCEPQSLRDLRDVAAARLADWPGVVALNQGLSGDAFIAGRRRLDPFPWVLLEFSSGLWMKPDGTLQNKRVREFAGRLESILTLWCRLQAW
jgi:hypothetical protein